MRTLSAYRTDRCTKRRQALTLVEVLLAIVLLGSTSLVLLHLMQDFARVVQRSEFEALAAGRCESAFALMVSSRDESKFNQLAAQLSDDQVALHVQVKDSDVEQVRLVSITAQSTQPNLATPFTLSRLIYLETSQ